MFRYIYGGYTDNALSATKATNLAAGATNSLPYQTDADTTAMLAANATATIKSLKSVSSGTPAWTQDTIAECSDYTSGTWTPVDASGAGLTFAGVSARYIKIGNMVRIWAYLFYPVQSDPTTAKIGGLPLLLVILMQISEVLVVHQIMRHSGVHIILIKMQLQRNPLLRRWVQ